jgi:2-hydroxy-3-keto-5-methylthiopentenyl-1-phosphate phosphatase
MGYDVIRRFAGDGWKEINDAYCSGDIGSKDAYNRVASLLTATKDEILTYVLQFDSVDSHFEAFYRYCVQKGFEFKIVSDGFDFYIEAILEKYGLCEIEFYSNNVIFHEDRTLTVTFPWHNNQCDKCGNCKRSVLKKLRRNFETVIYIGDGYSDVCPAEEADLVFAKSILYEKCLESDISTIHYGNFDDVKKYLEKMEKRNM